MHSTSFYNHLTLNLRQLTFQPAQNMKTINSNNNNIYVVMQSVNAEVLSHVSRLADPVEYVISNT